MGDATEGRTIQACDLAAMSPEQVRFWVLSIIAVATMPSDRLSDRQELGRIFELPFVQKYDASETLADLLGGTEADAFTFALVVGRLIEVLLDPLRSAVLLEPDSPEGERLAEEIAAIERVASLMRADGDDSLAAELEGKAAGRRLTLLPRRTSGAPRSVHGDLARELERVLLYQGLAKSRRRDVIARLLTDFVKPTTPRQVSELLREARRLDRRAAQRSEGEALYVRGFCRLDDEPMVERRDRRPGSFAGFRLRIPIPRSDAAEGE